LQLFDLANILDEYQAEIGVLPQLSKTKKTNKGYWATATVAGVILAVGLSTLVTRMVLVSEKKTGEVASVETTDTQPTESEEIPIISKPNTPMPSPTLPPELSSTQPVKAPQETETKAPPPTKTNTQEPVLPSFTASSPIQETTQTQQKPQLPNLPILKPSPTLTTKPAEEIASISQLTQVKNYFQQHWYPPQELKEAIEYRLVINPNGSLAQIIPLGEASEFYLDKTGMPKQGDIFVSQLKDSKPMNIRLVLTPNGTVQTFREQ
jgi:hypothetical protein